MPKNSGQIKQSEQQSTPQISFLCNAIHWYILTGIIVPVEDQYKLILLYRDNNYNLLRYEDTFPTLRGARIAFARYFNPQHYSLDPGQKVTDLKEKPFWSKLYKPANNWLQSNFPDLLKAH